MSAILLCCTIFLFAGFLQGFTGFGSALVAIPLLTLLIGIKTAIPLTVLAGLLLTAAMTLTLKRSLAWRKIGPLLLAALPGIALGALLLRDLPGEVLHRILGGLLVAYAVFGLLSRLRGRRLHRAWAWLAGFGSGLLGTTLGAMGPPVIVYTSLTTWTRDEIKATLAGLFLAGSVLTASAHAAAGLIDRQVLILFAAASPAVLAGVAAGLFWARRTAERDFKRWVFLLLGLMGLGMLVL